MEVGLKLNALSDLLMNRGDYSCPEEGGRLEPSECKSNIATSSARSLPSFRDVAWDVYVQLLWYLLMRNVILS
jgi:hypothetical protein